MELAAELKTFFKGDVQSDAATLETYSHDASLFEIRPQLVVFPKDVDDVKGLVRWVAKRREVGEVISLTPRSAGTDMTGGALSDSIVVSFTKYFNQLKDIGADSAVVEPGVFYRDFEAQTLQHNLLLPTYPASRELCTVGGMVANNSGGEKTLAYGKTEDYVRGLKVVLRDGNEYAFGPLTMSELEAKKKLGTLEGEVYRRMFDLVNNNYDLLKSAKPTVSKNSAGYFLWNVFDKDKGIFDLTKLFVGSQGTLGILTEITFRLVIPKPHSRLLVIFLKEIGPLANIVNEVLKFQPESFESYDDHTLKVAMRFFPDIAKRLGGNIIKLAFSFLPELWMVITGGMPTLVLLAEFTGMTEAEAAKKAKAAEESLRGFHLKTKVASTEAEAEKYWTIRRESFNLLRHRLRGLRTAPFIDDFVVRPEHLPEFLPRLYAILNQYQIMYTVAGHVGDGNFHIIPLMNLADPESKKIIEKLSQEVYLLVAEFHGSITGEHNDGLIRTPFLNMMYNEKILSLFKETKKIFDPEGILNPGKKVDGSLSYALSHVNTK